MIVSVIERNWKGTALDGFAGAVARVADAEQLLAVLEADLDRPAVAVALDDLGWGGSQVGGDQRQLVAAGLGVVLDEDHAHQSFWAERLPQTVDHGQLERLGVAVATNGVLDPSGGGVSGDLGELGQSGSPFAWSAALAGARRSPGVERGVGAQPGCDRDPISEPAPCLGGVCGVAHHIDLAAGQPGAEQTGHLPCQLGLSRPLRVRLVGLGVLRAAGLPEPEEHRQADGALQERQLDADPDHDPVVAPRDRRLLAVGGRAVMPEAGVDLAPQPMQKSVIDGHQHSCVGRAESLHDQLRDPQSKLVHRPPRG
jgi:hypothetical protein